jgi:hypothetical protein
MGRSWGTNLQIPNPALLTLASDTAVPAGGKTTVLQYGSSPLLFVMAGGGFYLFADLNLVILLGATAPSAMVVTLDLPTAGANQDTYTVPPAILVNSATIVVAATLFVPTSGTIWFPTGDNPTITVNPTGQAVTAKAVGTRATLALYQGL